MRYALKQAEMTALLNALDTTVLDLPEDVLALEDGITTLKAALDGSNCAAVLEGTAQDVLLPDALAVVVRCENVAAGGRGVLDAVRAGDETMADDARGNAY